jgi:signal peptidase
MRAHGTGIVGTVVGLVLLAALWLMFAPTPVGGSTSYAVTEGVSMLPLLHSGNLAVVRPQASYRVGDAVLYNSPVLHRPVLHRIIAIDAGQYSLQGDNNDFVDPGTVPATAIVGRLWFHVPHAGGWVGWLTAPLHAALLAVGAALVLLLGGTARHRRRDRRRGHAERPAPPVTQEKLMRQQKPVAQQQRATRQHGTPPPRITPGDLLVGGVTLHRAWRPVAAGLLVSLLLTVIMFAVPAHRDAAAPGAFRQVGGFSYVSKLVAPNAAYPEGLAQTGDPLLLELVKDVSLRFNYQFNTRLPHHVKGTIALNSVVSAATSYHRTFPVQPAVPFTGDTASIEGTIDLAATRAFFDQLSADSGAVGADYRFDLQAVVTVTGDVGGKPIHETFTPVLPFSFTHQLVRLAVPSSSTTTGGDYLAPTTGLASILNPEQSGSIAHRVNNTITFARFHLDVVKLRILGLLMIALTFAAMVALAVTRPPTRARREQDLITKRYGRLLVPVEAVNPDGRTTTELPDFHSLARFAQHYEHMILAEHHGRVSIYAVDEDGRLYTYRIDRSGAGPRARTGEGGIPARTSEAPPAIATRTPHAPGREGVLVSMTPRKLAKPLGVVGLLIAALTVVTGFTASNTVPVTYAGKSLQTVTDDQLAPVQCRSISLTSTIVMSSAATSVTGTGSNELILGVNRHGMVNYNGNGGDDCIVAGGGSGTATILDGGSGTDICIGAPGAANTFKNCEHSYN